MKFQNKKLIIFDLDLTLVKIHADYPAMKDEFKNLVSDKYELKFENVFNLNVNDLIEQGHLEIKELAVDLMKKYEENCEYEILPATLKIINYFNDKQLVIDTNNLRSTAVRVLGNLNILSYFDIIIGFDSVLTTKPFPTGVEKILKYIPIEKENILFIGDGQNDYYAAHNAGVEFLHIEELYKILGEVYE
jgi:HAD superfamily hydrolase (TIGR01549 family)